MFILEITTREIRFKFSKKALKMAMVGVLINTATMAGQSYNSSKMGSWIDTKKEADICASGNSCNVIFNNLSESLSLSNLVFCKLLENYLTKNFYKKELGKRTKQKGCIVSIDVEATARFLTHTPPPTKYK